MPPHDPDHIGDEPIYCETQHDETLYSGSEDDYYEAPEHRRMRIEAKAVQFLNGNVPYLLSARLKGPFDAKSWDNPWKSKRAQRQSIQKKSQIQTRGQNRTQSRRSMMTIEAARGHSSDRAIDDLPDTQRTSLYPLPSPETTNPPSTRKNQYMAEEEFNRIKTWRETVKSVPVSTDPFWASNQDASQPSTIKRKKTADQDWLRKRESKKRKSEDLRRLAPAESPSQAAAKTRRYLLPGRFSEIVMQSAPGSSTHEDELAAHWGPHTASFDTSRMANIPTSTPRVLQATRTPQPLTRQFLAKGSESSEDELSMPSNAPSRSNSRWSPKQNSNPTVDDTPSRWNTRDCSEVSWTHEYVGEARSDPKSKIPYSQKAALGTSILAPSQQKEAIASVSATQAHRQDIGQATLNASQTCITKSHRSAQQKSTRLAKKGLRRPLGASQQDNSFLFHQAASKCPSTLGALPQTDQMKETTLILSTTNDDILATAIEHINREDDQPCDENDNLCTLAPPGDQLIVTPSGCYHELPPDKVPIGAPNSDENTKLASAVNQESRISQPEVTEAISVVESRIDKDAEVLRQPHHARLENHQITADDLCTHTCAQELSPVSMQHQAHTPAASTNAVRESPPTTCLTADDGDASNPEWSTYISTQDLPIISEGSPSFGEAAKNFEFVSHDGNDTNEADWTTYVNTQDITGHSLRNGTPPKDEDGLLITALCSEGTSDSERSTSVKSQDQLTSETPNDALAVANDGQGLNLEPSEHKSLITATDDSDWSSNLIDISRRGTNQTGNTSTDPVLAETPAQGSRSSQVILGAIIDAYAESKASQSEVEACPESQLPTGDSQIPGAAIEGNDGRAAQGPESGRQEDGTASTDEESQIPVAPMEQVDQPMRRPEKSAFQVDYATVSLEAQIAPVEEAPLQSPWAKNGRDFPMPVVPSNDDTSEESTSRLSFLAGQALAFSPAPQTPWGGGRLPSPDFSLSVKRFSDFTKPSPSKTRHSADESILRGLKSTFCGSFGTPMLTKPKRHVTFAPLPGREEAAHAVPKSKDSQIYMEEDLSYYDAKGKKTACIRVARSQTRAASPPPFNVDRAGVDELPDHDHKFARHFEVMSKRRKDPPRRTQRLLPSDSQQTNGSQAIDAMAEAFIQASQTRKKSSELVEAVDDNTRLAQTSDKLDNSPGLDVIEQQENIDPIDDVSAVLNNLDDFLDNSWGFDTSLNIDKEKDAPTTQRAETVPNRFANVGDPMLEMHANIWAD